MGLSRVELSEEPPRALLEMNLYASSWMKLWAVGSLLLFALPSAVLLDVRLSLCSLHALR